MVRLTLELINVITKIVTLSENRKHLIYYLKIHENKIYFLFPKITVNTCQWYKFI